LAIPRRGRCPRHRQGGGGPYSHWSEEASNPGPAQALRCHVFFVHIFSFLPHLFCLRLFLHLESEYKQSDIGRNHVWSRTHFWPFPIVFR
jgi:hypothetical protein